MAIWANSSCRRPLCWNINQTKLNRRNFVSVQFIIHTQTVESGREIGIHKIERENFEEKNKLKSVCRWLLSIRNVQLKLIYRIQTFFFFWFLFAVRSILVTKSTSVRRRIKRMSKYRRVRYAVNQCQHHAAYRPIWP